MIMSKVIKVNESLSIDNVFEKLKADGNLPVEPYTHKAPIGGIVVYIPGAGDNDIQISVNKGKMSIVDVARPQGFVKSIAKEEALSMLTGGWSKILSKKPSNKELFENVLSECKRLFEAV